MSAEDVIKSLRDFSQKAEKGMFFKQKTVFKGERSTRALE